MVLLRIILVLALATPLAAQTAAEAALAAAKAAIRMQDYAGALALLQAPELQNSAEVLLMEASLYQTGRMVPRDDTKAFALTQAAAELGDVDAQYNLGRLLLAGRGVAPDRAQGQAWITRAAEGGHIRAAALLVNLLQSPGVQPRPAAAPVAPLPPPQGSDISQRLGRTALMEAAARGQHRLLETLLTGASLNAKDNMGQTALMLAVSARDLLSVDMLLRAGADTEITDKSGTTALGYAAETNDRILVRMLVSAGAWPDVLNRQGQTPLDRAIGNGQIDIALLMLEKRGLTLPDLLLKQLWFAAARTGNTALMTALAGKGASCQWRAETGESALEISARAGDLDALVFCLATAGVESLSAPLIEAAKIANLEMVAALLEAGAEVDSQSNNGNTALLIAARQGNAALVELVMAHGAEINHRNQSRNSALMLAAQTGNAEIIRLLIAAGADTGLRNRKREQAADIAAASGYADIANLLN